MASEGARRHLNENQARALTSTFAHLEDLFAGIERAALASEHPSPFSPYVADVTPVQRQVIADSITLLRGKMKEALETLGIPIARSRTRALWGIQTSISFAEISIEDVSPSHLRGYGNLDPEAAELVERLEGDLERGLERLGAYLARSAESDLAARLARLELSPLDLELLKRIEEIVTRRGLVEFRASIESLLETLETGSYEIAFLGRVSCGKSSLLNAVLGEPLLPVGVAPVTSVPTRITWGETAEVHVRFADAPEERAALDRLAEFVSEVGNAENRKRITRVAVKIPSDKLRSGVALVDTPGLGSLATAGARESYTYLPRCDLGVLLIDGAGVPSQEDMTVLRLLYDSGIPALVAITKADLLAPEDRYALRRHVQEEVHRHMGPDLSVGLVSTVGEEAELARTWFELEVAPLYSRARELLTASAKRKLAVLREGVVAALKTTMESRGRMDERARERRAALEEIALDGEAVVRKSGERCQALADAAGDLAPRALLSASRILAGRGSGKREEGAEAAAVLRSVLLENAAEAAEEMRRELVAARDGLRVLARRAAEAFPHSSACVPDIELDLVAQPAFRLPDGIEGTDLRLPRWPAFAHSYLEGRIHSALERTVGHGIQEVYSRFGGDLRDWSRRVIARLAAQFSAFVEPLRGVARGLSDRGREGDAQGIASDLRELTAAEPVLASGGTARAEEGTARGVGKEE